METPRKMANLKEELTKLCLTIAKRVKVVGGDELTVNIYSKELEKSGLIIADDTTLCDAVILTSPHYMPSFPLNFSSIVCLFETSHSWLNQYNLLGNYVLHYVNGEFITVSSNELYLDDFGMNQFKNSILNIWKETRDYEDRILAVFSSTQERFGFHKVDLLLLLDYISEQIESGKDLIFFCNCDETAQPNILMMTHRVAELLSAKYPQCKFFHFSGGHAIELRYLEQCEEWNLQPVLIPIAAFRFEEVVKNDWIIGHETYKKEYTVIEEPKEKLFLSFNRVPRWHRVELIASLINNNLLDKGYCSFDLMDLWNNIRPDNPGVTEKLYNTINDNMTCFPLVLNRNNNRDNPIDINMEDAKYHENSYFSIVTETVFYSPEVEIPDYKHHYSSVFFSEKIFKPIVFKHPFILLGQPGSLKALRSFGYKTFDGIIDESYDLIENDHERFNAVIKEVLRLCKYTPNEWIEFQQAVKPILEHNAEWLNIDKDLRITKDIDRYF